MHTSFWPIYVISWSKKIVKKIKIDNSQIRSYLQCFVVGYLILVQPETNIKDTELLDGVNQEWQWNDQESCMQSKTPMTKQNIS